MTSQTKTMPVGRQTCQNCKVTFLIDADDSAFYEMMQVPAPTFCPECRLQRRLMQRNERSLYKRKCDLCGASIIAMYSPNKPYKVYCHDCWYSDKWDALEYGRDYDPSQSFFQQLKELQLAVPHLSLFTIRSVNSPWINYEGDNKNGYLNFGGHQNEDCAFNQYALKCRDCLDNYWIMNGEYCYENILCEKSYKTMFSTLCFDCRDTYLSFDCRNCSDVIGCSGLRHKQYCIFNEYVGKEGYEKFLRENPLSSYESLTELKKRAAEFWRSQPQKAVFCEKSVNISGNLIYESKNCHDCVSVEKSENIKHGFLLLEAKDSYDMTSVWKSDLTYEFLAGIEVSDVQFSTGILDRSSRVRYSHLLFDCHDCFGCINMRKKQYCILNKQYDKASFDELKTRIIARMRDDGEYGEFFPPSFSPYTYEETVANEYFPLSNDEAKKRGYNADENLPQSKYEFTDYEIPDDIKGVSDEILAQTLKCSVSGKAYRIINMELAFYRRFGLPIPREAPFPRHRRRLAFIANHRKLIPRSCGKCGQKIQSVYAESEFPTVYCERCYNAEVV